MAAEQGHEVTLFINPYYIATGQNYCFARLNAIMDQLPDGQARFEGRYFETDTSEKSRILRAAVKSSFCREHTEERRQRVVEDFAGENGIACSIPDHLKPLTPADISALRNQGVTIGNHGWCHPHYSVLSEKEAYEDIRLGREWLQDDSAGCFAVPFGDCLPMSTRVLNACQVWLLSCSYLSPGFLGSRVFNRTELDAPEVHP
jgi:peptidoglycan/xylan/chitin deacetylase (PgdA/CDA1 family)